MARSTTHYADSETNNILKRLHNKLRPAGTPVERVEYIIELLLLRIFEAKLKQDEVFKPLRELFTGENYRLLFSHLLALNGEQILSELNKNIFPFYSIILTKARAVVSGNLPQKIQDQLSLMEAVYLNSNFAGDLTDDDGKGSGVMSEVIDLVNDIDEKLLLKSDLLGDAIESALSETGGTKDLGLYRTPDHIRKMMVQMVDPDFTDTIFDPACGTAGFLFDAYDYVIGKAQRTRRMPSENVANMFYRAGIGGIEYQRRIRKMAAVNMYIRGLNPQNIKRGDSLKIYDPSTDAGSKTVVIANPPFGAERDQPAYPNVWEEYSKESETTILFVKLMFDLLKTSGRCAVVVSEGFLTWLQGSALALRKILLNEANLRAVISLPQGVFVSKSGQGAKTSILYFEKGQPTSFVWFYKIENDGFSMGTNRKAIANGQIPELLEIFNEVKLGKKPQDTKHSFCISKEQIETLDPRIAERIKKEVSEKTKEKNNIKREKLVEDLDKKLSGKKISKETYDEKLWQFDNIIEGQIDNEIAKAIEKAHSYHFNLQNYRSSFSDEQIKDWQETLKDVEIKNGSKIEKRYEELQKADPKIALQILAYFDTKNALQMDIAREYLRNLDKKVLKKDEKLQKLEEILRKGFQYPQVEISELITPKYEKIKQDDFQGDFDVVEKISFGDGKIHIREKRETGMDLYKSEAGDLITSKINVHQGAVAISPSDLVCSTHYQIYSINETVVNPKYLLLVLRSSKFLEIVNIEKAGGIKNEAGAEFLSKFKIPLPSLEIQKDIVEKIEKKKQMIEGAKQIEDGFELIIDYNNENLSPIGQAVVDTKNGWSPICNGGEQKVLSLSCLKNGKIDFDAVKYTSEMTNNIDKYFVREDDFFYSRGNTKELVALAAIASTPPDTIVFPDLLTRVVFDPSKIIPKFAVILFNSQIGRKYFGIVPEGGTPSMIKVSAEYMKGFPVPFLGNLEAQHQIIEKLEKQMQALEGVRLLKIEAQKRIEEILAGVWGSN
ncbi:N-6 DNA methylase [Candidatus Woesebacteria bacterium]|nr:N-6 DNA methylase [Candidatus Woesebacteria bacterium]